MSRNLIASPLNTVPKKNLEDRRVILDLSFPHGKSVNNGIQKSVYLGTEYTLSNPAIDDFIDIIINKGEGCLMYKKDLRRAYRQIPVDPGDINMLGFYWKDNFFIDVFLPFGLRSAAMACRRVTNSVSYIH